MYFLEKHLFIFAVLIFFIPISILAQSPIDSFNTSIFSISDHFECDPKKDAETLQHIKHYQNTPHEKAIGSLKPVTSITDYTHTPYQLTCPQQIKTVFH
ncbi:MAG: hypothetical protein V4525_04290 [Pseudomonadota bacterium]